MLANQVATGRVLRARLTPVATTGAYLVAVAAVAVLDYITGPDLAFALFYLVPVSASAWYCGRPVGLAIATVSSLAWVLVELLHAGSPSVVVALWSAFTRLAFFTIVALLLAELRTQQINLEHANQRLLDRNAELDAFAGRVAHDLRDAMAPIANAGAALRSHDMDPHGMAIAAVLERSSAKAVQTINSLLAFARAEQPGMNESAIVLDAVRAVIGELGPTLVRSAIRVDVSIAPDVAVRCDNGLLLVVCSNVIGNAVKFLHGCRERRLSITADTDGFWVDIDIVDTGPGISPADQAHVFKPFFRGANRDVASGIGIGLATVERIVTSRGGEVGVESDGVHGSRFRIRLPAA